MDTVNMTRIYRTSELFVAGGQPSETYNPRSEVKIEQNISRFLQEKGKVLALYGASKTGKTVLVEKLVPSAKNIWLLGQDITSLDDFWSQLASKMRIAHSSKVALQSMEDSTQSFTGGVDAVVVKATGTFAEKSGKSSGWEAVYNVHPADAVRQALPALGVSIVIDDFHFIPDAVKASIARAIKTLINHTSVIAIAVPSESLEIIKEVPNMEGRVWKTRIPNWTLDELQEIASNGFALLAIRDSGNAVARTLAEFSYGSPFIMQQLCRDLVMWTFGVEETKKETVEVCVPSDLDEILADIADRIEPSIFTHLLTGPNPKGHGRNPIELSDINITTDIYGAILTALRNLVPPLEVNDRAVSGEVQIISSTNVARDRVTSALRQMSLIADRRRGDSDPVVRFMDQKLYIQDAVLAFYLRHGRWSAEK